MPRRISPDLAHLFKILGLYLVCAFLILVTYTNQIAEANAYLGLLPWEMTGAGYLVFAIGFPICVWEVSRFSGRPSDFFRLFYITIALLSFLVLHSVTGKLSATEIVSGFYILLIPVLIIELVSIALPRIRFSGRLGSTVIDGLVIAGLLLVMIGGALSAPDSAGFNIDLSYDRRLEGREIYSAGSVLAYGLGMAMNGFAPFLAFRSGQKSSLLLFAISLSAAAFFFWLIGVKGPIAFVLVAFVLGVLIRKGKIKSFALYFLSGISLLGLIAVIEWYFLDGYSFVVDYIFRRVFSVQAEVQAYYLQFLFRDQGIDWSWWYGNFDSNFRVTYHIGSMFFGSLDANVNTNTFLDQLSSKGFIGYTAVVSVVAGILSLFDRLYQSTRNPSYIFLGFIYGLLMVEQVYTVALVTSGVGVIFLLTLLEVDQSGVAAIAAECPDQPRQ